MWMLREEVGKRDAPHQIILFRLHEKKDSRPWPGGRIGPELLATNLREMTVVDRSLKPHYILESAPKLTRYNSIRVILRWKQMPYFISFHGDIGLGRYIVNWSIGS